MKIYAPLIKPIILLIILILNCFMVYEIPFELRASPIIHVGDIGSRWLFDGGNFLDKEAYLIVRKK